MSSTLGPSEIVGLYIEQAWNESRAELVREICANPITRHYSGGTKQLSHDEQIERINQVNAEKGPKFSEVCRFTDGIYVTSIWNNTYANGKTTCGIEVFKVVDGRITDVWNPRTYEEGSWA